MVVVGIAVLDPQAPARGRRQYADVLVPDSALDVPKGGVLGSVQASADGDLAGATPQQSLRARVSRMIRNAEDTFAHLAGWGLGAQRGKLGKPSELARMALQAQANLRQDPDIVDAKVKITPAPNGVRRAFLYEVSLQDRLGNVDRFLTTGEDR